MNTNLNINGNRLIENSNRYVMEALESRLNPSVTIDALGLATVDVHLDLALNVTTPVGVNVDLALSL